MTITKSTASLHKTTTSRLFLSRGVVAIAWAAVFAAVAGPLTFVVGAMLVLYPLIDVVGSLVDARGQDGSARRPLLANAAASIVAAGALAVAATGSAASIFAVFGMWAVLAGMAQLVTALHRRVQLGSQWPMLLAGVGSVGFGLTYLVAAAGGHPDLRKLAIYAAGGGIDFVVQAWLLARRGRRALAPLPAVA